jgi:hypothetical protein
MTSLKSPKNELPPPSNHITGVRGHGVLASGLDQDGSDALAVWQVGTTGNAEGAWILKFESIHDNAAYLQRVLELFRDRCFVDWSGDRPAAIVDRIAELLPERLMAALIRNIVTLPDLLEEVSEWRSVLTTAVEDHCKKTKSKIAPLVWPVEVPDRAELVAWSAIAQRGTSPVAADALALTAALRRTAELWHDTEQARYRRTYLRSFGDPQTLPPRWTTRLRTANS